MSAVRTTMSGYFDDDSIFRRVYRERGPDADIPVNLGGGAGVVVREDLHTAICCFQNKLC
jgi:hypothetical protein